MRMAEFDHLLSQFKDISVGTGATPDEIEQAQSRLGLRFSRSYVNFLDSYGWAKIKHAYVYGLGEGIPGYLNVVRKTIVEREAMEPAIPKTLVPLMNDGSGNHYCLDCNQEKDGEMPVVFWDHEAPAGSLQVPEVIESSFEEWLMKKTRFLME